MATVPPAPAAAPKPDPKAPLHIQHPKFKPAYHAPGAASLLPAQEGWVTPLSAPAFFPRDVFHTVLAELTAHPEQNSSLILRAEVQPLRTSDSDDGGVGAQLGLEHSTQRLRFVPRQPRRDGPLEQRVHTYAGREDLGLVLKLPDAGSAADVPYYHPAVRALAFVWEAADEDAEAVFDEATGDRVYGRISISYLPFEDSPATVGPDVFLVPPPKPARKRSPLAPVSEEPAVVLPAEDAAGAEEARKLAEKRLQRTCLALLEKLHKHGHGSHNGYVKRVIHDVVVSKAPFQDLYQALKERHHTLESRKAKAWSTKVEDVKRHVWKDIAIAAFLMLLWKDMYPAREGPALSGMEWDAWGRPAGGFIDLGCGNALLVHILISEGYRGKGYELRARRTWPEYPAATQAALVDLPINMPSLFPETLEQWDSGEWPGSDECVIKENTFLIGNHADELTPWLPLLSLLPPTPVPHLSLPCCLHTLDDAFTTLDYAPPPHPHTPRGGFDDGLEAGSSRYKSYVMWLGWCGLQAGWMWEKEPLRIPSTRGWGIVARKRWATDKEQDRACRTWALQEVDRVRHGGAFKVREKEGNDH
ncbi:tRNA(Ser) Um(44) 2'-O-methyltransferase [Vanrija albida]|uniref:tRNA (uracil-O(2)-)-methyltransferase n=1 Tax=Vanrija albida TaxID=181172 RepID=A0ABR3QCX9_9TREE